MSAPRPWVPARTPARLIAAESIAEARKDLRDFPTLNPTTYGAMRRQVDRLACWSAEALLRGDDEWARTCAEAYQLVRERAKRILDARTAARVQRGPKARRTAGQTLPTDESTSDAIATRGEREGYDANGSDS